MNVQLKELIIVGDSLSKGVVFEEEKQRYTTTDQSYAKALARETDVEIKSFSRFGATVRWGFEMVKKKVMPSKADAVLIEFGGNDCDYNWEEIASAPEQDYICRTPVEEFVDTLCKMGEQVKQAGKKLFMMNLPPINAHAYFAQFTGGCKEKAEQILKWLGTEERIYWWHELYSLAVERAAKASGAVLINVRSAFLLQGDIRPFLCRDGIHLNEQGHAIVKDVVGEALAANT